MSALHASNKDKQPHTHGSCLTLAFMAYINRPRQERLGTYAEDASAAETAAKMELKIAKLKMQMAAAKLQYLRATAAYQAAMSGQDAAKTNPSFSTRFQMNHYSNFCRLLPPKSPSQLLGLSQIF